MRGWRIVAKNEGRRRILGQIGRNGGVYLVLKGMTPS